MKKAWIKIGFLFAILFLTGCQKENQKPEEILSLEKNDYSFVSELFATDGKKIPKDIKISLEKDLLDADSKKFAKYIEFEDKDGTYLAYIIIQNKDGYMPEYGTESRLFDQALKKSGLDYEDFNQGDLYYLGFSSFYLRAKDKKIYDLMPYSDAYPSLVDEKSFEEILESARADGENTKYVRRPMVMLDDTIYYYGGEAVRDKDEDFDFDGVLEYQTDPANIPYKNKQGNFPKGKKYRVNKKEESLEVYEEDGTCYVYTKDPEKKINKYHYFD